MDAEMVVIKKIADRAAAHFNMSPITFIMDVSACHSTTPLLLQELLEANDADFIHDIAGINKHLNRQTYQLMDTFLPRYAAK